MGARRRVREYAVAASWPVLIFFTSCFFIPLHVWIPFVVKACHSEAISRWFPPFWAAYWFLIVKGWHFTEYAILVLITAASFRRISHWQRAKSIIVALIFAVLFAASDEWHQTFVPGRDGCVRDVLIDSAGALASATGLLAWYGFRCRRQALE